MTLVEGKMLHLAFEVVGLIADILPRLGKIIKRLPVVVNSHKVPNLSHHKASILLTSIESFSFFLFS